MRVKTWKVLDMGKVPETARLYPLECGCGTEALVPMLGIPIAACGSDGHLPEAIVFDGAGALPKVVQCRTCRRIFTKDN
jgi:hypothetical protein